MSTTMTSLNVIYGEEERRGTIEFYLVSFVMTIGAIIFLAIILGLVAVMPAALSLLPIGGQAKIIGEIIRWPIVVVLLIVGLAVVYRFAPCRREVKWQWMSWGSVVAIILWITASAVFSFYVGRFGRYDRTFGSLGAVVVLLTWLYLSAYAVFLGACLDADRTPKAKPRLQAVR
jgi:membrane protein